MKPLTYYNENDPDAAAWLRELIRAGLIAPGDVDERSIADVQAEDVRAYRQCHFFAGIGGWSYALRLAGWPDDRPIWTGSCPCQPFSVAGKAGGLGDERHLWPAFQRIIAERRPPVVAGEQVARADGRKWLAGVRADLETLGYAVGATDLCAAGVGAPHIRQRLFWVADAGCAVNERGMRPREASGEAGATEGEAWERERRGIDARRGGIAVGLADAERAARREGATRGEPVAHRQDAGRTEAAGEPGVHRGAVGLRNPQRHGLRAGRRPDANEPHQPGDWSVFHTIPFRDGKTRRIEPGIEPLAHGVSRRVVKLRGYGNAIVPQVAAAFIAAYLDAREAVPA